MSLFKRRRFPVEIILLCVRWYCKYGISYRDLVEMMQERGVEVDLWFAKIESGLKLGGIFSDTNHVCSVC